MSAPARLPGIEGAILDFLNDPIAALCLARQIDRDAGVEITANLQEAAIAAIAAAPIIREEVDYDHRPANAA